MNKQKLITKNIFDLNKRQVQLPVLEDYFTEQSLLTDLTHCGLVTPYDDTDQINIGSGNDLVPDGTKPLPEPMLTSHQRCSVAFSN